MADGNSPSTLSYLRQYRFQKKPGVPGSSGSGSLQDSTSNSNTTLVRMPAPSNQVSGNRVPVVYKRIRIQSSDSEDNASPMKKLTIKNEPGTNQPPVRVQNQAIRQWGANNEPGTNQPAVRVQNQAVRQWGAPAKPMGTVSNQNNPNPSIELTVAVKEKRFRNMIHMFPDVAPMMVKNVLVKHAWSEERARDELLKHDPEFKNSTTTTTNHYEPSPGNSNGSITVRVSTGGGGGGGGGGVSSAPSIVVARKPLAAKGGRARRGSSGSEDDDFGVRKGKDDRVYDSDDSDSEISNDLVGDKRKVFDFLNTSNMSELSMLSGCSQKKAEAIMALRPFKSWTEMIEKFNTTKCISAELLNATQELLGTRNNIQKLMKKCVGLAQQLEAAVAAGTSRLGQPVLLDTSLKLAPYQIVGLNWLAVLNKQGVSGILADEMGLGKTVQVIAFLAHLKETGQAKGTHLIVVPASTLDNWSCELARWCGALKVSKYYGNPEERRQLRIEYARHLDRYDIVLTTYTMVHSCPEERKMFRVTPMHYVIYDEAHMLKNMSTQRYDNLLKIKSKHRLLLTGTPLQNNLIELMSLLCFVMPHMFSGKTDDLKNLFQKNSKYKGTKKGESTEDDVPPFEQSQITQAKRIMKPFVLRRLKREVLQDLPTKTNKTELVPMSEKQDRQYKDLCAGFAAKDGTIHSTLEQSGISMMMDMRKLANHPLLLRYYYDHDRLRKIASRLARDSTYKEKNEQYVFEDLQCLSDFQIHQLTQNHQSISSFAVPEPLILDSGKFKFLDENLPRLKAEGHRVLLFSQFTMMLDILEPYMSIRRYRYLRLDGSTAVMDRQDLIDQYNTEDIFVFLLSTKAGGLGINLTAADTVIIHDIDFNPYNDKQAEDRCHRLGQTREVTIYRLLSAGTIEEGMHQVAQEKLNLEKHVTGTDEKDPNEQKNVVRLLSVALGLTST